MKLQNKLLTILLPTTTITAIAPITFTSCNKEQEPIISYAGKSKDMHITGDEVNMWFKLANKLKDGDVISVEIKATQSKGLTFTLASKTATVYEQSVLVKLIASGSGESSCTLDFNFVCRNEVGDLLWTSTLTDFNFTK